MTDLESVKIRGLRYLVVTLREEDVERIAQKVARLLRDEDRARVEADFALEHQRMGHVHDGSHPECLVCNPVLS